ALIKHTNPCGTATHERLATAFLRAYEADPISAFGCVMALNRPVDEPTANAITEPGRFVEAIIAPAFSQPAFHLITTRPTWKSNVRLIEVGDLGSGLDAGWDFRRVTGGLLVQTRDVAAD